MSRWANYKARSLFSPFSMVRNTSADVGLSSRHKRNASIPTHVACCWLVGSLRTMRNVAKPTSKNVSFERRVLSIYIYMGGCQNDGPFVGTLNIGGRIVIRTQKGTIILTTNHIYMYIYHGSLYVATF